MNVGFGGYKYVEPGDLSISIHGPKFGGEYKGTVFLNKTRGWFAEANVRGIYGKTDYDGWCAPFLITPNNQSPNGYELDLGDYSPCDESGDHDGYLETRGLFGKDFISQSWAFSPQAGLGFRHLSNGVTGVAGYRKDNYLYLPLGVTARTLVASHVLGVNLEYDFLLHGWQTTRQSALGGGLVPASGGAPAFTIEGFTDMSFDQHDGWALRASAKYDLTTRWFVEPSYIHWNVSASDVSFGSAVFTVNGITAEQQVGAYEPDNTTDEFMVKFGWRF